MGSWSVYCGISNIAITSGQKCILLPIKKNSGSETREWQPATLPIFGEYNDYGGIENIDVDDNTKLIEEYFGITIDEFCQFLVDGKFTYDRSEAKAIFKKIKNQEEIKNWQFMWIDRQVFDFMIINHDKYHKGYMDYGTPEMLKMFGFEFVEKSDTFDNYDPKRFNQLWKKGKVKLFSDGRTILSKKNRYVYHFGKGDETSIETYFEVPEELEYLKDKAKHEAWRLMSKHTAQSELGYVMGSRYDFNFTDEMLDELEKESPDSNVLDKLRKIQPVYFHKKYYTEMDKFGDRIAELINISQNLHPMSGRFAPHVLYLTPQCGEYQQHQVLLEKFCEINKSRLHELGGEEEEE